MSSQDDARDRKVPRRRFLKWTGTLAAAGLAGVGLGYAADIASKRNRDDNSSDTDPRLSSSSPAPDSLAAVSQVVTGVPIQSYSQTNTASMTTNSSMSTQMPEDAFSVFWITDTQFLSETNPALYRMMTTWIVNNWKAFNGKLVIHTGDVVQTGDQQDEWNNAQEAMSILTNAGIPYSWCAGNHDDLVGGDPSSGWMGNQWTSAFNPSTMAPKLNALKYTNWVGDYHQGMNTAVTFTASGLNFLVINVEWNADATVVNWVSSILDNPAYSNHHVIIAPHAYIDAWGLIDDPRWGPTLADFTNGITAVMDQHSSNIFLTLNGHFATDQGYNTPMPTSFRNLLMFDRQDCRDTADSPIGRGVDEPSSSYPDSDKVGGSTVTILTFDKSQNQISVKTYDVYTGQWRQDLFEQYTFTMFP